MSEYHSQLMSVVNDCLFSVQKYFTLSDFTKMKLFLQNLHELIKVFSQRNLPWKSNAQKMKIDLCFSQIKKILQLILALRKERIKTIPTINDYLKNRLSHCLDEILQCLTNFNDEEEDNAGMFLRCMDIAIQLAPKCEESPHWGTILDNLLCYALTIGKFSSDSNHKEIFAGSQNVMRANEKLISLNDEEKNNKLLYQYYVNDLITSLETLERRVNFSVLQLVLSIFSEPEVYLKELVQLCPVGGKISSIKNRSIQDIDALISKLDFLNDTITQIGLFAMACSGHKSCISGIRCCLASLESLEEYIVPAMSAFYLDPLNISKRLFLKFLINHWLNEVKNMEKFLDRIIDPAAFCQTAANDLMKDFMHLKKNMKRLDNASNEALLTVFLNKSFKLSRHLRGGVDGTILSKQPSISGLIRDLKHGTAEIKEIITSLKAEENYCIGSNDNRITKRCAFVVTTAKKLAPLLETALNESFMQEAEGKNHIAGLCAFPESVRDLPLDVSDYLDESVDFVKGFNDFLDSFDKKNSNPDGSENVGDKEPIGDMLKRFNSRVEELSTARNTLYQKTPKKMNATEVSVMKTPLSIYSAPKLTKSVARTRLFQEDTISDSLPENHIESTLNLEITGILENITQNCNTFNDSANNKTWNEQLSVSSCLSEDDLVTNFDLADISDTCCIRSINSVSSAEPSDFDTLRRMNDIKSVEEKLRMLQSSDK